MKRERAIELLKNFNLYDEPNCMGYWDCDECVEALYIAIESLEKQSKQKHWIDTPQKFAKKCLSLPKVMMQKQITLKQMNSCASC